MPLHKIPSPLGAWVLAAALSAAAFAHPPLPYGDLPLAFEPNLGQTDSQVRFIARTTAATVFITGNEAVFLLARSGRSQRRPAAEPRQPQQAVVRMQLSGSLAPRTVEGLDPLPGSSNYFLGQDPSRWRTGIPTYAKARLKGVYPGVDLIYYGHGRRLEFDFFLEPGADPRQVEIAFDGVSSVEIGAQGDLALETPLGALVLKQPRAFQPVAGGETPVPARFRLRGPRQVAFDVGPHNPALPLRIDPVFLIYSTYLGGGAGEEDFGGVAVDSNSNAYIVGTTLSTNFPLTSPIRTDQPQRDVYITKLNAAGTARLYSTYLGGNSEDWGYAIAVDSGFNAYITGSTESTDFPLQNAFQGDQPFQDAFVAKLAPAGNALLYSTYLGGAGGSDAALAIAVHSTGRAYVAGLTDSPDFPTKAPYQTYRLSPDAFVTALEPGGASLHYSTYLGGSELDQAWGLAVDAAGYAFVAGKTRSGDFPLKSPYQSSKRGDGDLFVTRLVPAGNDLAWSTYLGGSAEDYVFGLALHSSGAAYIAGYTVSADFPTTAGAFQSTPQGQEDAFVTRFSPGGATLTYSTRLGGARDDQAWAVAVDSLGGAYVTGFTTSPDFPLLSPTQTFDGVHDAFVTRLAADGRSLTFSTPLGGRTGAIPATPASDSGYAITVDTAGGVYIAGQTITTDFPTRNPLQGPAGQADSFVTKLAFNPDPISVTPSSGSGSALAFDALYRHVFGHQNIAWVQLLFATQPGGGGQPYCFLHYDVYGNSLWLYSDVWGFFAGPVTPGTASNTLQGSLCALNTAATTVTKTGTDLTVRFSLLFKQAAARNIYMRAFASTDQDSGWLSRGAFNLAAFPLPSLPTVAPASGSGLNQTFQLSYFDYTSPPGIAGFPPRWVQFLVAVSPTGGGLPFCYLHYDVAGNRLWMYSSDVGFFLGPVAPGAASTLLNSTACSITTAGAAAALVPNGVNLTVPVVFKTPMRRPNNVYQRTMDSLMRDSGHRQTGTFTP